jgi:putative flippase GtrA
MYETLQATISKYLGAAGAKLTDQFARYFVVALVGLVFDFGTLVLLHDGLHVHYLLAAAAGFVVGLTVNYALSTRFVFKDSKLSSRWLEFVLFGVVGLIGLGILSAAMWLLVGVLGMWYILAKCLATVVVYIWNFVGRKAMYRD